MSAKKKDLFRSSRQVFESYKDTYRQEIQKSIDFVGQDLEFFTEVKTDWILYLTRRFLGKLSKLKVLDVGCGVGITDHYLTPHFKKVYGIDLSQGVVKKAAFLNPEAEYRYYAGKKLPYPDNSMDVTFAVCVLHHVEPEGVRHFTEEMMRVTKKGGLVMVFEHNPLNPLTRRAVSQCKLDEDAHLLRKSEVSHLLRSAGGTLVCRRYIFFTPFRSLVFGILDRLLGWLPLGAQYFVTARK